MRLDTSKYTERLGFYLEKLNLGAKKDARPREGDATPVAVKTDPSQSMSSLNKITTGAVGEVGEWSYFPPEVIGGSCPRVAGEEEQIACGTPRNRNMRQRARTCCLAIF